VTKAPDHATVQTEDKDV